ncbi:hypothetical protein DACRYDRAFT_107439 [Dacryopinax primogenitus]|uniref:Uncharacterized protein n=1 Tax=Dacryopinax primogenitus (strain DJM 731) TaxID=1858805 RepID=M5FV93_DACPD|nr:uncharacterized protein DACRYDRAFT_107439 [Dacryopinax primogenitus]EJU01691.1 hypothetical protein DACRYDRAFT_107439 [Dacryopinax primogenitus]
MAPSSTRATSGKKPLSSKTKPKASSNKKPSAADTKKGSRARKASGKKTRSKELVESSHDELTEPEEEDPPAMPEPKPAADCPALNARPVATKVRPLKKASMPPLKTSTPKLRVSWTRSSTWIEKELELHEEPEEEQEPETATEERAAEDGGEANDESPRASSSLVELKAILGRPPWSRRRVKRRRNQPSKGLPEILAMVPPFGADPDAWRANGSVSEFQVELVKFRSRHNKRKYWQTVPLTAASFMGPTFQTQWHARMGNQLVMKLLAQGGPLYLPLEEWVEGDRKAVVGRDNKPPFDSSALRHRTELEAILAANKEPDENLEASIKAEEKAWNALSVAMQAQHLALQKYRWAGIEGSPPIPVPKVVTPIPLPKKAVPVCLPMKPASILALPKTTVIVKIPAQHSQSRVSVSAAASLPPSPSKSLSVVESTPAPDESKKADKAPKAKLSMALLALAAEAEPDPLPMPDSVSHVEYQAS